jgi:hypothetical protein
VFHLAAIAISSQKQSAATDRRTDGQVHRAVSSDLRVHFTFSVYIVLGWPGCLESGADVRETAHISASRGKLFSGSVKAKGRNLRGGHAVWNS